MRLSAPSASPTFQPGSALEAGAGLRDVGAPGYLRAMITIATIAEHIERERDTTLPGRSHLIDSTWHNIMRLIGSERRDVRDHRRRRAAILVRVPVRGR
jgi:hypothetical protein